jgi:hypothetical protein
MRLGVRCWRSRPRWRHFLDVQTIMSTIKVGKAFISPTIPSAALLAHLSGKRFRESD